MFLDSTSEAIAHFIGLFNLIVEDLRVRKVFREFHDGAPAPHDLQPIETGTPRISAAYDLVDFRPHVPYTPEGWLIERASSARLSMEPITLDLTPFRFSAPALQRPIDPVWPFSSWPGSPERMVIQPPGSVIAIVVQTIQLEDRDILVFGNHGLELGALRDPSSDLDAFLAQAGALSPLMDLSLEADSVSSLIGMIAKARTALAEFQDHRAEGLSTFTLRGKTLDGLFVNGAPAAEVPDFDLYRPLPGEAADAGTEPFSSSFRQGGQDGDDPVPADTTVHGGTLETPGLTLRSEMEVTLGENLLLNEIRLTNQWLASSVTAVGGDHIELNAIIQFNAWADADLVGSGLSRWTVDHADPTLGFNIAQFKRIDASGDEASTGGVPSFPKSWAVTEITGDLVILNWIEQFTFLVDHDISVMSAYGSKVTALLGGNSAFNEVSLDEIGLYYDLIFVGGSIYDVNLIQQMNLLLDNDLVGAAGRFETSGHGSLEAGGNLLWNQANITQVGAADRFSAMPDAYREALGNLIQGRNAMPEGVLSDPAFANLAGLRVLYIRGDVVNLQYASQVNVLGDADQVVLAQNRLAAQSDADWTVTTGANTLVNVASIVDVDGIGKTYVGGEAYSDEILIQADFVPVGNPLSGYRADALVSEAVLFLDDDMLDGPAGFDALPYGPPTVQAPHPDVMHTMLA